MDFPNASEYLQDLLNGQFEFPTDEEGGANFLAINHGETGANARELRANMKAQGIVFNPGDQAHHIVPSTDGRTIEAIELRATLEDFNIDINDADNGVALSSQQHHGQGLHSKDNYRKINNRLDAANNEQQARMILRDIAREMESGTYTFR